jgi:hypothetical protein
MTRAGTSTCRESTGTSRPSLTTALSSPGGATQGAPTAPRSGSGTPDHPQGTAPAAHRMVTAGRRPERDRLPETAMAARPPETVTAHPREAATAHRLRMPPQARVAAPVTSTHRRRRQCGAPGPAADGMPVGSGPASNPRLDRGWNLQRACAVPLPRALARPAALGYDLAQLRRGLARFRRCRQKRAELARAHPAPSSLAGTSLAGTSAARGGRAPPAPVRFRPRLAAAGLQVPARCRLLPSASQSPVRGDPRRSRCPSSDPAASWRSAPLVPG